MGLFNRNSKKTSESINTFLEQYKPDEKLKKPDEKILEFGKKSLPKEVIKLWTDYGFGNYGNGMIKIVDPRDYMGSFYKWIGKEDFNKIPIAITAFGDIFFYDRTNGTISFLDIHYRQIGLCTDTWQEFFDKFLANEENRLSVLREKLFNEALKKIGKLADNEIYMFVPALVIGGTETAENLEKGDASTHQHLLFDLGTEKIDIEVADK